MDLFILAEIFCGQKTFIELRLTTHLFLNSDKQGITFAGFVSFNE